MLRAADESHDAHYGTDALCSVAAVLRAADESHDAHYGTDALCSVAAVLRGADESHDAHYGTCLLYTSPSPRDGLLSRMPSSA